MAEQGVYNAISLQPFGCIANHIISKGIEKRIKSIYPKMNLLFLDFDASTSDANVFNRLHFMVKNAKTFLQCSRKLWIFRKYRCITRIITLSCRRSF